MRPESAVRSAIRKGFRAACQNFAPMLVLQSAMAAVVVAYYEWPAATALLSRFSAWQHGGGILVTAVETALAGGVLSEISLVYFQDGGRWSSRHLDNLAFKFAMFFISGAVVFEFYGWQAIWFGEGASWAVMAPKILVDQCIFSVFWSTPYQTLVIRWHDLRYSFTRLRAEVDGTFVLERMLPILVMNWMFWIPGVILIYSLPTALQTTLFIFATAIWGLLLPSVMKQERAGPVAEVVVLT